MNFSSETKMSHGAKYKMETKSRSAQLKVDKHVALWNYHKENFKVWPLC